MDNVHWYLCRNAPLPDGVQHCPTLLLMHGQDIESARRRKYRPTSKNIGGGYFYLLILNSLVIPPDGK